MYQSYPTSGQPQEPARTQPPQSVLNAVKLMYAGAALNTIGLVIYLVTLGGLKAAIKTKYPNFTPARVHATETATITGAVIVALITIGLWLWMANANGKGRSWARIVASVLFALNTLDLLASVTVPHAVIGLIFACAVWLVGLGATVLMWNRESGPFYSRQPA